MTEYGTILLSILTLLGLFYQLYLQRVHNEKSLKPLGQIDFRDRQDQLYVRVSNNGVGPMIVDRLCFIKGGQCYPTLDECLDLDRRSYARLDGHESVRKVILPNSFLTIFEVTLALEESETAFSHVRDQLSLISLKVDFHDIYDNKMSIEQSFQWFTRHRLEISRAG